MRIVISGIVMLLLATAASAQDGPQTTSDPTQAFFLSASDVRDTIANFEDVAYANITVLERADGEDLAYRFAIDRRRPPQRGAQHSTEAELWTFIEGSGQVTTGGTIVETTVDGVVDRHIEGGVTRNVSAGDFLFIPEGVPHEVTAFTPQIIMATFEILRPPAANMR